MNSMAELYHAEGNNKSHMKHNLSKTYKIWHPLHHLATLSMDKLRGT